ncbi:flagellar hook-basal body protein [Helicobacter cappadocius]|uniref:Flagellar hook-basal body protein n=1 Tax=Helicobacter cappadocius TaxID=3063998 RepID=A0AA90PT54_9HELI|nr:MULTISPECIES: flagellar hook-basal body protein [unclassified Helicobacter]MDO7252388.1 flagellar hook-basal body protein [Helicobacter sp. faydin-H75]MDP2538255.1 flagellar hook-basal body protein [Helicobacter sp. faydin-H76]
MQSGYYSATGGMVTQFNRLDIISNNLANLNTNSFKRDDVVIGDFLRLYQTHQETLPLKNQTREAAKYINRNLDRVPIISEEYTDKSIGAMSRTENPLDFALDKENAYFAVQTPNGVRYTRDGSFTIGTDGTLSTKEGYQVLSRVGLDNQGGILIPQSMEVEADKNGNLYFRDTANENIAEPLAAGSIAIVSFANPKYLKKVGKNLYEYPENRLNERENLITPNALYQHYVEKSNVNAVIEMSNLIETNRLVDMYSKVLKTHMDDLNTEAISKLATRA